MKKSIQLGICLLGLTFSASTLSAAEKFVLHCFTFTPMEGASQSDFDAFYKSTNALPSKIKGLKKVYAGKLSRPTRTNRAYGACMEFENEAAYKAYGPDPAHKAWEEVYSKVRTPGTDTWQLMGQ